MPVAFLRRDGRWQIKAKGKCLYGTTREEVERKARIYAGGGSVQKVAPIRAMDRVYLASAAHGPVKIGRAADPNLRHQGLQCGSPYPLVLVVTHMPSTEEKRLHYELSPYRLHGEWFDPACCGDLSDLVGVPGIVARLHRAAARRDKVLALADLLLASEVEQRAKIAAGEAVREAEQGTEQAAREAAHAAAQREAAAAMDRILELWPPQKVTPAVPT